MIKWLHLIFVLFSLSARAASQCESLLNHPTLAQAQTHFQVRVLTRGESEVILLSAQDPKTFFKHHDLAQPLTQLVDDVGVVGETTKNLISTLKLDTSLQESWTVRIGYGRFALLVLGGLSTVVGVAGSGLEHYLLASDTEMTEIFRLGIENLCVTDPVLHDRVKQILSAQFLSQGTWGGIYAALESLDIYLGKQGLTRFLEKWRLHYALYTLPEKIIARNISNLLQVNSRKLLLALDEANAPSLTKNLVEHGFSESHPAVALSANQPQ